MSQAERFGTPTLSDALDRCGVAGQALGIGPLRPVMRLWGPAFTVRLEPTRGKRNVGDFIDDVEPGAVVVLDAGGRTDATVWGDLLTLTANRRGVAGTVIHGVCRDSLGIAATGYPLFSRGVSMRTGKGRLAAVEVGGAVSLGSTTVHPGDLVVGDADGVVVVPTEWRDRVEAAARDIERAEATIRARVEAGAGLATAREEVGYHALQAPPTRVSSP